ncbi:hypothetical protein BGX20_007324 [Mortierella sp. AD010]|nr:hypothetical protein BGX20_007324 [Mortierella sp. AD010]
MLPHEYIRPGIDVQQTMWDSLRERNGRVYLLDVDSELDKVTAIKIRRNSRSSRAADAVDNKVPGSQTGNYGHHAVATGRADVPSEKERRVSPLLVLACLSS